MQLSPFATLVRPSLAPPPFAPLPSRRRASPLHLTPTREPAPRTTQPDRALVDEMASLCRILSERESPKVELEIGLAPHSESNLVIGLDGTVRGVFYATYEELELGTTVALRVQLPGDCVVSARARVEWIRWPECGATPGLGLRFTEIEPSDAALLACFADRRDPVLYDL